ncbi:MAG: SusC/RagA family TonB-linked outer membrane protein [Prolixibacteraceae bacterium]|jgi:TonB-linked SusC/RagA family outer membrane protein|nr:SusC/RagA family TonB-linked outer membrane protein [Prolixibacteraceae bacterium]
MKQQFDIVNAKQNRFNANNWSEQNYLDNGWFENRMNNKMLINSAMNNKSIHRILSRIAFVTFVLLLGVFSSNAQDSFVVKGVILSPENEPVSNVSVSVEGSREMPAFTNDAGEFEITAPSSKEWITIAPAFGYKRKRLYLDGRTELAVMVTPIDLISGEDEVIILNQPEASKNMASALSNLELSDIKNTITPTFDRYMQGRIAGVHVINQSGAPGAGAVTFIRGVNSLNASTQPLYLVDGVIMEPQGLFGSVVDGFAYNPLSAVNPLDISNATVHKDAVYSAAYGSKASNGLIMISTLDPSATETSFEIDMRTGLSLKPDRYINQLNAQQHKTLANELILTSGMLEEVMTETYENLFLESDNKRFINYQHDTDWQKYIFEDAMFSNFNLKVKGGDEIARYGLSFGYYNNNGIIRNTKYDGYNLRFVSLVNIYTWLRMNASVSFNTSSSNLKESARISETSPILSSLAKSPLLYPYQYDTEGLETVMLSEVDEFGVSNPLATIQNFEARNKNYHIITSLGFEIDLPKDLLLRTNVGILYNTLKEDLFMPNKGMERYYNDEAHNVSKASTNTFNGLSNNTMLIYNKKINTDHVINSTTGLNVISNKFQYDWGIGKNAHENDEYRQLNDGINDLREMGGDSRNWNWLSVYEKVSYTYQDKYLATATVSLDGSSRIGKNAANTIKILDNPFGLFYSLGLGWRVSNESFLNDVSWVEELKLRASIGRVGNDDIGETNATNYYRTVKYRTTTGVYPATIPNTTLSYELVDKLNLGIDMALWGNRIRANFDVYSNTTSNMLVYQPLESYFGYDFRPENSGKMENVGFDAYAFVRIVNNRNFKWDIEANISQAKNQILEIENDKFITTMDDYEVVNQVGSSVNSFYGYNFLGVYSTTEEALNAGLVNDKGTSFKVGNSIFEDISGPTGEADGVINAYDKTIIGSQLPDLIGGITNTFKYKNWTLSAFVNFVSGNDVFNYLRFKNESMTDFANQSSNVLNRWQYEGQITDVPAAMWDDPIGNSDFSTRWIENGSFLRLKNLSLSYKIPHEFWAFKNAEFYISASNLITLSNYLGYDPESAYSYNLVDQGVDYGSTPTPRQFMLGIKIGL